MIRQMDINDKKTKKKYSKKKSVLYQKPAFMVIL